jgi:hypothetical protein
MLNSINFGSLNIHSHFTEFFRRLFFVDKLVLLTNYFRQINWGGGKKVLTQYS